MSLNISAQDIHQEASKLVTEWVFPNECYHTPDVETMARADKLGAMLKARMNELVAQGVDPRGMSIVELLPGVRPHEIELREADFC